MTSFVFTQCAKTVQRLQSAHLAFPAGATNGAPFCRCANATALAGHAHSIEISSSRTRHIVCCTKSSTDGLRVVCAGVCCTKSSTDGLKVVCAGAAGTINQQQSECSPHGSGDVTFYGDPSESSELRTNGITGAPETMVLCVVVTLSESLLAVLALVTFLFSVQLYPSRNS